MRSFASSETDACACSEHLGNRHLRVSPGRNSRRLSESRALASSAPITRYGAETINLTVLENYISSDSPTIGSQNSSSYFPYQIHPCCKLTRCSGRDVFSDKAIRSMPPSLEKWNAGVVTHGNESLRGLGDFHADGCRSISSADSHKAIATSSPSDLSEISDALEASLSTVREQDGNEFDATTPPSQVSVVREAGLVKRGIHHLLVGDTRLEIGSD